MADKPKIKTIIFDLGGVIAHGGYLPFIQQYCLPCLTGEGKKKIARLERQVNLGNITEHQFFTEINRVFHVDLAPRQMRQLIIDRMKIDKHLIDFIPKLKPAKLALFSNSIGRLAAEVIKKEGLDNPKLFDKIFFSNKIHLAKPDKEAYQYVVKHLGVKPGEALMIDDRAENITKAQAAGLHGIVYQSAAQFKQAIARYELV